MDTRRLMLLSVFLLSLFMLWEEWHNPKSRNAPDAAAPAVAVSAESANGLPAVASQTADDVFIPRATGNLRGTETRQQQADELASDVSEEPEAESLFISTDLVSAEISTRGGALVGLTLKRYQKDSGSQEPFTLLSGAHAYLAQSGLIGVEGVALPNHKTLLRALPGARELADGADTLEIRLAAPEADGIRATKVYTFHRGSYLIDVSWEIENGRDTTLTPDAYFQLQRDGANPDGESFFLVTFTGAAVYTEAGKYQKASYADIAKGEAKFVKQSGDGWLAMVQHYFVTAWAPQGDTLREFFMRKLDRKTKDGQDLFAAGVILPVDSIAPGQTGRISVPLFAGPQEQSALQTVAPGLDLVVDYGWLHIIAAPIFWVLEFINNLMGNWGWSIVALTVLIKLIFYPLSAASYRSMAKMRVLTPRLMQLKERYADDKVKMNQEMMKLYQTEKVNPLGGCLPILVQIPVFIALYWVLLGAVEMRGAPWILWIHDLSVPDPYFVLPVIMMVSMFVQIRLNPTPPDPMQARMMLIMPLVFGVMFFFFPAGLVLYWVVNNILSIAQQWQINRALDPDNKAKQIQAANDKTI
ncbi:MAG: membrane protein insertase YidC [Zoogloeaceae bacterium]|jgi:YidC/Oxa1 family membrane protein insertase|nr:membrane protein insertase YidC [Zoogloeaceae bacterium]